MTSMMMRHAAFSALLGLPIAAGAAHAQQSPGGEPPPPPAATVSDGGTSRQADALVATVGEAEIRGSDVMSAIGALPPRLQAQSPEMLVPLALDQLILRELILEQARARNLAQDPEVAERVEGARQGAEEDAMVQVWLERELAGAVTDAEVRQVYDRLQARDGAALPPIDELRPQIERHLRQQAVQEIADRLRQDARIVFYDPAGQPIPQAQGDPAAEVTGTRNTASDAGNGVMAPRSAGAGEDVPPPGGWIGVEVQDVTPQIARALGHAEPGGALVAAVAPDGPAAQAGIAPGSVITAVGDEPVADASALAAAIARHGEGDQVTLTLRTGARQTEDVSVVVGMRPGMDDRDAASVQTEEARPRLGVAVTPLSPDIRGQMRLPPDLEGIVVSRVEEGSPAAAAELAEGDVIVAADRTQIGDVEALRDATATASDEGRPLLLRVYRDGAYSYIPVELGSG